MRAIILCVLLSACAQTPELAGKTEQAVTLAKGHVEQVLEWLERAQLTTDAASDLAEAREAYGAGEYVSALSSLRGALDSLKLAGVDIPEEAQENMLRAEALLMAAGAE